MSDRESVIDVTTVVGEDSSIRVDRPPFQAGQPVGITIRAIDSEQDAPSSRRYPLAGLPVEYREPLKGLASEDWEASHDPARHTSGAGGATATSTFR